MKKKLSSFVNTLLFRSEQHTHSAELIDLSYTPEHTQTLMMPVSTGKSVAVVPIVQMIPDSYSAKVKLDDGKVQTITIDKTTFDSLKIGDTLKVKHDGWSTSIQQNEQANEIQQNHSVS